MVPYVNQLKQRPNNRISIISRQSIFFCFFMIAYLFISKIHIPDMK